MFREEETLLAGAKNGNAPTIVSSKCAAVMLFDVILLSISRVPFFTFPR